MIKGTGMILTFFMLKKFVSRYNENFKSVPIIRGFLFKFVFFSVSVIRLSNYEEVDPLCVQIGRECSSLF